MDLVYVVTQGDKHEYEIVGVYTDGEVAAIHEALIKDGHTAAYDLDRWTPILVRQHKNWQLVMDREYKVLHLKCFGFCYDDVLPSDTVALVKRAWQYPDTTCEREATELALYVNCWAFDYDSAVTIATDIVKRIVMHRNWRCGFQV